VNLRVRVNDERLLHAGATEEVRGSDLVIHPPKVTLFRQVLAVPTTSNSSGGASGCLARRSSRRSPDKALTLRA